VNYSVVVDLRKMDTVIGVILRICESNFHPVGCYSWVWFGRG
jgi:hypothetical protein